MPGTPGPGRAASGFSLLSGQSRRFRRPNSTPECLYESQYREAVDTGFPHGDLAANVATP